MGLDLPFAAPEFYRQSLIAAFDSCRRRALYSLLDQRRTPSEFAAVGIIFHRWHHRAIEEMRAHGERQMPVDQGLELLTVVAAQRDIDPEEVVPITMKGLVRLRILVVKWCLQMELSIERIVDVERRLTTNITIEDGEVVAVSGQLDTLFYGPGEDEAGSLDAKTGFARPRQVREEDAAAQDGRGLTELGWTQSVIYALLVFDNFPSINRFWFREWHVFWGESREVVLERWSTERLRDTIAAQVAMLHRAVRAGPESPLWVPSAGPHCALCAMPRHCPIRNQVGIPADEQEARRLAQEWILAGEIRKERAPLIKGYVDAHGPVEVPNAHGRRFVGWDTDSDGKRTFGVFEPKRPEPAAEYDEGLAEVAREAGVLADG